MIVVIVPAAYTPGKARAAALLARAVPPGASPYEQVLLPGPDLAEVAAEAGAPHGDVPVVALDPFVKPDGIFLSIGLTQAVGRALATGARAVALDGCGPTWMLLEGHGCRVGEVPQTTARALFWEPDPPAIVHFCPREMYGHYVREWLWIMTMDPVESRNLAEDDPGHRLRFHHQYAAEQRVAHHPRARAKRAAAARLRRAVGRLKFW